MFARKQKSCVNGIQLVTDDGLCNPKAYHKVKIVFIFPVSSNYFVEFLIYFPATVFSSFKRRFKTIFLPGNRMS